MQRSLSTHRRICMPRSTSQLSIRSNLKLSRQISSTSSQTRRSSQLKPSRNSHKPSLSIHSSMNEGKLLSIVPKALPFFIPLLLCLLVAFSSLFLHIFYLSHTPCHLRLTFICSLPSRMASNSSNLLIHYSLVT